MKFKNGDIVIHKASEQKMVVVVSKTYGIGGEETPNDFYKCSYLNEISGLYEVQEFSPTELEDCPHIFATVYNNQFYCPDCHLCMEVEENKNKKVGKKWYEIQDINHF